MSSKDKIDVKKLVESTFGEESKAALRQYFQEEKTRADELSSKMSRNAMHDYICSSLHATYLKKNRDYGDAFGKSLDKFGIVAAVTRMSDKMSRIETLYEAVGASRSVADESLEDTLLDLANYAIMTVMWLRERDDEVGDNEVAFYADNQKYFTSNCNRPFKSTYEAEYNTILKELRDSIEKFGVKADEASENLNKNLESIVEGMCIRDEI